MSRVYPSICVAICTHRRPEFLSRALDSLAAQTQTPDEILVIDNAPADHRTRELVLNEFPVVRYVREPIPGLNFARNRAIDECASDVLAYIDDDAIAGPEWIAAVASAFRRNPQLALCTGRVLPLELETPAQRLFESQGGFDRGEFSIDLPADLPRLRMHRLPAPLIAWSIAVGVGANMAIRKDVFRDVGPFDTALDLGAVLPGGGDVDMIWRTLAAGHELRYEPDALVHHAHRRDMGGVEKQICGHRRAEIAFLVKSARAAGGALSAQIWAFMAWRLVKPGFRLVNRATIKTEPLSSAQLWRLWREMWRGLTTYPEAVGIAAERAALATLDASRPT